MSLTTNAKNSFNCCPCWYYDVPNKQEHNQKVDDDWAVVNLTKKADSGRLYSSCGKPAKFVYVMEISSGDLYGIQQMGEYDSPETVAQKAIGMAMGTCVYFPGMILAQMIKLATDCTSIFWKIIPQLYKDFHTKNGAKALGNFVFTLTWVLPSQIVEDIWRIARSPIYALGLLLACTYGAFSPYEGRKWIAEVEKQWHQGASYKDDIRHGRDFEEFENSLFTNLWNEIWEGKIFFLGYCMQQRGNIKDKIGKENRFAFYERALKNTSHTISTNEQGTIHRFSVSYMNSTQYVLFKEEGNEFILDDLQVCSKQFPSHEAYEQFIQDIQKFIDEHIRGSVLFKEEEVFHFHDLVIANKKKLFWNEVYKDFPPIIPKKYPLSKPLLYKLLLVEPKLLSLVKGSRNADPEKPAKTTYKQEGNDGNRKQCN